MQANLWLVSSSSIRGFHMSRSKPRLLIMERPVYSTLCLGQLSSLMPLMLMIYQRCKYFFTEHNCQKSDSYDAISCNIAKINVHSKKINYSCSSNFPNKTCINPILRLFIPTSVKLKTGSLRKWSKTEETAWRYLSCCTHGMLTLSCGIKQIIPRLQHTAMSNLKEILR